MRDFHTSERNNQSSGIHLFIHVLCQNHSKADLPCFTNPNRSRWQAQLESSTFDNSIRIEHGRKRWATVNRIEAIIQNHMASSYATMSHSKVLAAAWLVENTFHRLARTREKYLQRLDEEHFEEMVSMLIRRHAIRIISKEKLLARHRLLARVYQNDRQVCADAA